MGDFVDVADLFDGDDLVPVAFLSLRSRSAISTVFGESGCCCCCDVVLCVVCAGCLEEAWIDLSISHHQSRTLGRVIKALQAIAIVIVLICLRDNTLTYESYSPYFILFSL